MKNREIDFVTLISKGSSVSDGHITTPSHVKIAGVVKMNIESEGKVVVAESGVVEGNINAMSAQIHGKVSGEINVVESAVIYGNAEVNGLISAEKLTVEEGAICNLVFSIGQDTKAESNGKLSKPFKEMDSSIKKNGKDSIKTGLFRKWRVDSDHSVQNTNGHAAAKTRGSKSESEKESDSSLQSKEMRSDTAKKQEPDPKENQAIVTSTRVKDKSTTEKDTPSREKDRTERFW